MTTATAVRVRDIYTVAAVSAARDAVIELEARDTALRIESDQLWRILSPNQVADQTVSSTQTERITAQRRQEAIRIERDTLRVEIEAAERAATAAVDMARAENVTVYATADAALCERLDVALGKVLAIVAERESLADEATRLNRGRQVDGGPVVLNVDAVSHWKDWRRTARRP